MKFALQPAHHFIPLQTSVHDSNSCFKKTIKCNQSNHVVNECTLCLNIIKLYIKRGPRWSYCWATFTQIALTYYYRVLYVIVSLGAKNYRALVLMSFEQ